MNTIAPLPVVVPLASAAAVLFLNGVTSRRVVHALTLVAVVAEIGLAAMLIHQARASTVVYWFGGWTPRAGVALGISFTIDQLGAGAALLAGIVTAAAVAGTRWTMPEADGIVYALFLTLLAAMAGFCLTGDLFNLFVFFELMAVSAFALTAYRTGSLSALRSALSFAITNSIGAFLVLIGIAMLYGRTGALNLAQIGRQLDRQGGPDRLMIVALSLLVVGLLIKAAVIPFHFWLIDTVASAPIPLVMILAGLLDTLGVYGVARIYWTIFATPLAGHNHAIQASLISIGAISALTAGALSLLFEDFRRRLAFVMVAHTGVVLIGVGCLSARGVAGSAIYAVGDGTVKAAVFVGLALLASGAPSGQSQAEHGSCGGRRRAGLAMLTVGGLATAGLPLFATGLGKPAIEDAAAAAGYLWVTPVIVLTAALTGAAVLDIANVARAAPSGAAPDERPGGWAYLSSIGVVLLGASALATAIGRWAATAGSRFVDVVRYQNRVLDSGGAFATTAATHHPISTGGVVLDLVGVAAAVVLGFRLKHATGRRRGLLARLSILSVMARRIHDGGIGDSAMWATVGTATIALVLATTLR